MKNWFPPLLLLGLLMGCGSGASGGQITGSSGSNFPGGGSGNNAPFNQSLKWVDAPLGVTARQISPASLLINSVGSPSISDLGRYVMFLSNDSSLVADDTNGGVDIFVRDTVAGVTRRRNVIDPADQTFTNVTTYVTLSNFTDTTNLYFSVANPENDPAGPRFYELGGGTIRSRGRGQVFSRDYLNAAQLALESRPVADLTGPIRIRLFNLNIADIDRRDDEFILTHANADCLNPQFGGSRVFFYSESTNLVPNDNNGVGDIFAFDLNTKQVKLVSGLSGGGQLNAKSDLGSVTPNGRYCAFTTLATNGYAGDTNNASDVFVKDVETGELKLVSRPPTGGVANGASGSPTFLQNFNGVLFQSNASNLVSNDTNNATDIFFYAGDVRDRITSRLSLTVNFGQAEGGSNNLRQCAVDQQGAFAAFTTDADLGIGPGAGPVHLYRSLITYPAEP